MEITISLSGKETTEEFARIRQVLDIIEGIADDQVEQSLREVDELERLDPAAQAVDQAAATPVGDDEQAAYNFLGDNASRVFRTIDRLIFLHGSTTLEDVAKSLGMEKYSVRAHLRNGARAFHHRKIPLPFSVTWAGDRAVYQRLAE